MELSSAKVGFIGAGNMAQALGKGMISAGIFIAIEIGKRKCLVDSHQLPYFDDAGLLKANQIWANAPDDGTLDVWKAWGCNVLINDNSNCHQ
jgi:hypothetical protein